MAKIYPDRTFGTTSSAIMKVYTFLKKLPDSYHVWNHISSLSEDDYKWPEFLVINEKRQIMVIQVNESHTPSSVEQMVLLSEDIPDIGKIYEEQRSKTFYRKFKDLHGKYPKVSPVILFPNLKDSDVDSFRGKENDPVAWIGKSYLKHSNLHEWEALFTQKAASTELLDQIRQFFCPEIIVPTSMTVASEEIKGGGEFVLDYDQEYITKIDLWLPDEQSVMSRNINLRVVNGVAGSGKTLILLYRLKMLKQFFPEKSFLVITHNRPLMQDMQNRFNILVPKAVGNIHWYTFMGWCRKWFGNRFGNMIGVTRKRELVSKIHAQFFTDSAISIGLLLSEIDWYMDQGFREEYDYLDADRRGRGFAIYDREKMLEAIHAYRLELKRFHLWDWGEVPARLRHLVETKKVKLPQYDFIFVDEAQFFAPIWFELIRTALVPDNGSIFLMADPTQGFLRSGTSWKSQGFSVQGRTHTLNRSYRNTWEILNFATLFYRRRLVRINIEDDDIVEPDFQHMPRGVLPIILPVKKAQDEVAQTVKEVMKLVERKVPLNHILVLHPDWYQVNVLIEKLKDKVGKQVAFNPQDKDESNGKEPRIRVTTLNACTGLESPIVFVLGSHKLFEEEQNIRIAEDEREKLIFDNTKKIYMALTRAGQTLFVTYSGEIPDFLTLKQSLNHS